MRIAWLTDIHLNFLNSREIGRFLDEVVSQSPDCVIITGDISDSHDVVLQIHEMYELTRVPVLFVLGNHDYYHSSIRKVRDAVRNAFRHSDDIVWLSDSEPYRLSDSTVAIGHDSWADGRLGDYENSTVELNDFELIEELKSPDREHRLSQMQLLADEAVRHIEIVLPKALSMADHVIIATHVPPYKEASWYRGKISDDDFLPFFSCKAFGETVSSIMSNYESKRVIILCGHTHGSGFFQAKPNLEVFTGGATYGRPVVQRIFEPD
jgi:3',5'-cyclic-AMP phosphodiesterase